MDVQGLDLSLEDRENWIAIIGSRKANVKEQNLAYHFAKECAKRRKIVVSGLAVGIDAAAHKGAIDAGGKTIAIVNTPIEQKIYPKENRDLAKKIIKNGCIVHPFDTIAIESNEKGLSHFSKRLIERDVLVAHLCPIVVTIKEKEEKITGGTKWAMNYGRYFDKKVYQINGKGQWVQNPEIEKAKIKWKMELDIHV